MFLRQSTASQEISIGPFLDSTDGDTEEGGLTIANTDIKIRKHGATTLANKNSGGATVVSNGVYQCTLDATDTDTAGQMEIYIHVAGALAVKSTYVVLTATAFDALLTGTFNNLGGTAQTADHTAGIADIPTVAEFNARTLAAASYFDPAADTVANVTTVATTTTNTDMVAAAPTVGAIADQVWDEIISGHVISGSTGEVLSAAQSDLDVITGADGVNLLTATQASIDAIETDTQTTIPALIAALNDLSVAQVNAECDTAISDAALATAAALATVDTVADAIKVITDQFVFTIANQVDSNIQSINDVTVTGDGSATPFDV